MEKELIQDQLLAYQPKTSLCFISKGRVVNVQFSAITHVSKYGNETVVHTAETKYRTYNSLQELLNELPVNEFFRIHRSHIIALAFMKGVKRKRIRVCDYYLPISNYYKEQMCNRLAQLLSSNYNSFATV